MFDRLLTSAFLGLTVLTGSALADDADWVGLYKGLDALDGSIDYLSIAIKGPGEFDIRVVPSVFSLCENGKGWIVAEGRLTDEGKLHRFNSRAVCEGGEPFDIRDRFLVRDEQTGIVRFGATDDDRPLIYHRISTQ